MYWQPQHLCGRFGVEKCQFLSVSRGFFDILAGQYGITSTDKVTTMNAISANQASAKTAELCTICLDTLHTTESAGKSVSSVIPCGHKFHSECIYQWTAKHLTCPVGRRVIIKQEVILPLPDNWQELMIDGAKNGNQVQVLALLKRGAPVDANLPHSETPFAVAARKKHFATAQMLAAHGSTDPEGQFLMGQIYMEGTGPKKNQALAMDYFFKSADQGNVEAQLWLGCMYMSGKGGTKNNHLAIKWLQMAADQDDIRAEGFLGCLYASGDARVRDLNKSVTLLQRAANKGLAMAQNRLGFLYWKGIHGFSDVAKAQRLFQKATNQGHIMALVNLGRIYLENNNIQERSQKLRGLVTLLEKAAQRSHPEVLTLLADIYLQGISVDRDFTRALELFKRAADLGNIHAHRQLGLIYSTDKFIPPDYDLSHAHFQKAANQGDPVAHYHLGVRSYDNHHFPTALFHFQSAADKGFAEAQYHLGCMYLTSPDNPEARNKAMRWFREAARNGHKKAQEYVKTSYSNLTYPLTDENAMKRMKYDEKLPLQIFSE